MVSPAYTNTLGSCWWALPRVLVRLWSYACAGAHTLVQLQVGRAKT